jgi:hypothetical protein
MAVDINGTTGLTFNNGSTQDVGGVGTGGQTWQSVTGSRAIGTTYTNSTGKPISVVVGVTLTNTSTFTTLVVSEVIVSITQGYAGGAYTYELSAIVPNGASYRVTGGSPTLYSWTELR